MRAHWPETHPGARARRRFCVNMLARSWTNEVRVSTAISTFTSLSDFLSTDSGRDFALIEPGQARLELLFVGISANDDPSP